MSDYIGTFVAKFAEQTPPMNSWVAVHADRILVQDLPTLNAIIGGHPYTAETTPDGQLLTLTRRAT